MRVLLPGANPSGSRQTSSSFVNKSSLNFVQNVWFVFKTSAVFCVTLVVQRMARTVDARTEAGKPC